MEYENCFQKHNFSCTVNYGKHTIRLQQQHLEILVSDLVLKLVKFTTHEVSRKKNF